MKPRHPKLDWIKTVLADLEHCRGDPQDAALTDEFAAASSELAPATAPKLAGSSRARVLS